MRALSLWQPWASLIAFGAKRWETRSWGTDYRGPLLVHAALRKSPEIADPRFVEEALQVLGHADFDALPRGRVVAVCELTGCYQITNVNEWTDYLNMTYRGNLPGGYRELKFGDWSPERYVWKLEHVRRLHAPFPLVGHQGLWNVGQETIDQLAVSLAWRKS